MTTYQNLQVQLASRPAGVPVPENFRFAEAGIPEPGEGELLLKIRYLSLDPYMRGRMSDTKSYAAPVALDAVMEGGTVGEVVQSRHTAYVPGDLVLSHSGWQSYALAHGDAVLRLDPTIAPVSTALGVLGMPGFTAWSGLANIGKPTEGETLVVAAASGPVGATVGQIARIRGARAVGIAGGAEKCAYLRDELGFDAAIDHTDPDMAEQLADACPKGIDVYFENVGGKVFSAVWPLLNTYARIPVCGLIAHYNANGEFEGPDRLPLLMRDVLTKSLTIRGFINREFSVQREVFMTEMVSWLGDSRIKYREDIVDGLESAPDAFIGMLEGKNFGKLLIRLDQ